jgi:hypothetical protein
MGDSHAGPLPRSSKYIDQSEARLQPLSDVAQEIESPSLLPEESAALFEGREGGEQPGPARYDGIYRATCVNATDPLLQRRLQLMIPAVSGTLSPWAEPCLPPEWSGGLPKAGDEVWVMFEGGDENYPVWLGTRNG